MYVEAALLPTAPRTTWRVSVPPPPPAPSPASPRARSPLNMRQRARASSPAVRPPVGVAPARRRRDGNGATVFSTGPMQSQTRPFQPMRDVQPWLYRAAAAPTVRVRFLFEARKLLREYEVVIDGANMADNLRETLRKVGNGDVAVVYPMQHFFTERATVRGTLDIVREATGGRWAVFVVGGPMKSADGTYWNIDPETGDVIPQSEAPIDDNLTLTLTKNGDATLMGVTMHSLRSLDDYFMIEAWSDATRVDGESMANQEGRIVVTKHRRMQDDFSNPRLLDLLDNYAMHNMRVAVHTPSAPAWPSAPAGPSTPPRRQSTAVGTPPLRPSPSMAKRSGGLRRRLSTERAQMGSIARRARGGRAVHWK